jgi:hypothetical protein
MIEPPDSNNKSTTTIIFIEQISKNNDHMYRTLQKIQYQTRMVTQVLGKWITKVEEMKPHLDHLPLKF